DAGVGVTLVADAEVAAVALDGRRAVGVQLADGRHLDTDRVVVTAGAIGTPLLLAASGVDAPALGHGLRNHPGLPISVHVRDGAPGSALLVGALLVRGDLQIVPVHDVVDPAPDTLLVVLMAPTGRGRVRAAGDGVLVEEVLDDHDHARLESGRTIVFELLDHPAFRAVVDDVTVGTAPAMVYHPTSTCAMGTVVDADGAVFGYDGLHVADASVFPDIPRANTYLPTLMLAERLAWRLTRR
ncbi:MAG: GMC oxidoreductase, partial [Ilumatobacteraceae bacterium]